MAESKYCVAMTTTIGQPWGARERHVCRNVPADEVDDLVRQLKAEAAENDEVINIEVIEEGSMPEEWMPQPLTAEEFEVEDG